MIQNATDFLRECRKDKAFKNAVDLIDNKHIIDFAEAYAELRLFNAVAQSEQFCSCDAPLIRTGDSSSEYCGLCGKDLD